MSNEQRYRLNRLAGILVTPERFGHDFSFPEVKVTTSFFPKATLSQYERRDWGSDRVTLDRWMATHYRPAR